MLKFLHHSPSTSLYQRRATRQNLNTPPKLIYSLLLALFAGVIFSFALAPYHLWVLALTSPMVLYIALVSEESPKRAFWIGEFYGFGLWAVGAFWLYNSIHEYGNIAPALAVTLIAIMASIMGLFHAVMAWAFVRFLGRQPLAFAGLWVLQEWLKTWLFTGFPWLFVGYAFSDVPMLTSLAPVFGVFGLSFVAVLFACSVVELFRKRFGYVIISITTLLASVILYFVNPIWTKPTGETLSVALVQGNIPQDMKWLGEYRLETLRIYDELTYPLWGKTDAIILPEASIPMFQDEADEFLQIMNANANYSGTAWLAGIPYRQTKDGKADRFYNSVMALGADGQQVYKKQRLVPFGEYVPLQGLFNLLPDLAGMQNMSGFSLGESNQAPLMVKNQPIGTAICYEVAYPDTTRHNAKDSQILLTVSNDAWFGTTAGPHQHLQMVQMRSLETGRWFMRATNTGITAFINDKGQIVDKAPQFERTTLQGQVPAMTGITPFMRFGSVPILLLSLLLVGLSFIAKRQTAPRFNLPKP